MRDLRLENLGAHTLHSFRGEELEGFGDGKARDGAIVEFDVTHGVSF